MHVQHGGAGVVAVHRLLHLLVDRHRDVLREVGRHPLGPVGAAVMTSLSWFGEENCRGNSLFSPCEGLIGKVRRSLRTVADDSSALHLAMARRIVHHGIVLSAAVIPEGDAVLAPAEADLVFGVNARD